MNTRRVLTLLLTLLCCLAGAPRTHADGTFRALREATEFYRKAVIHQQRGEVAKARLLLTKATGTLPGFPEAHLSLGNIAFLEEQYDEALRQYEAARHGYVDLQHLHYSLQADRHRDATEQIQQLREAILMIKSGRVKYPQPDLKIFELESYAQNLERVKPPDRPEAGQEPSVLSFLIGNTLFHLGRLPEAIEQWEACAGRTPDFPLVHNNLAIGYLREGRIDQARASLLRAESLGVAVHPGLKREIQAAGVAAR
jgi:tetratricopeptide (TPR) repeat protein